MTEGSDFKSQYGQEISPLHSVQTGSGAHQASYSVGTGVSLPAGKVAGAWNWPLTFSYCRGQENVDLYIHSPIHLHDIVLN
jgi:hypothetical protein